jgi:hypothetical protein
MVAFQRCSQSRVQKNGRSLHDLHLHFKPIKRKKKKNLQCFYDDIQLKHTQLTPFE